MSGTWVSLQELQCVLDPQLKFRPRSYVHRTRSARELKNQPMPPDWVEPPEDTPGGRKERRKRTQKRVEALVEKKLHRTELLMAIENDRAALISLENGFNSMGTGPIEVLKQIQRNFLQYAEQFPNERDLVQRAWALYVERVGEQAWFRKLMTKALLQQL